MKDFTPEWAEPLTEISAAQIRETAHLMADAKPAVAIHPGRHVTWYGDDTQRGRAMAILTALLGAYGRKGGMFLPTKVKQGRIPLPPFPDSDRGRADGAGTKYPLATEESQGLTQGLIAGDAKWQVRIPSRVDRLRTKHTREYSAAPEYLEGHRKT